MSTHTDSGAINAKITAASSIVAPAAASSTPAYNASLVSETDDLLVKHALEASLGLLVADVPYISVSTGAGMRTMAVESREFARYLRRSARSTFGKRPSSRAVKDAQGELCDIAIERGVRREVFVRIARLPDRTFLDLCNPEHQVLELSARGMTVLRDIDCPVAFLRSSDMRALPMPVEGGTIDDARPFFKIGDDDFKVAMSWNVGVLCLPGPMPMLAYIGPDGSSKTFACRAHCNFLDPREQPLSYLTGDKESTMLHASQSAILAFDNLSEINRKQADFLCSLVTGIGMVRRKRYSDSELTRVHARRPVLISGINACTEHADLLSRTLLIEALQIDDSARRPEAEVEADLIAALPRILGVLTAAVCEYYRRIDSIQLPSHLRMADFHRMAVAVESALGWQPGTADRVLRQNHQEVRRQAVESSVVGSMVRDLVDRDGQIRCTFSDLQRMLREYAIQTGVPVSTLPTEPNKLSNILKRLASSMKALGYIVERERLNDLKRTRQVIIRRDQTALVAVAGLDADPAARADHGADTGRSPVLEISNESVMAAARIRSSSASADAEGNKLRALKLEVA